MKHLDPAQLAAYIDRRLSLAERHAVEAHLEGCPECVHWLAGVARTMAELRDLPDERTEDGATPEEQG